jgi:hypothetical protein
VSVAVAAVSTQDISALIAIAVFVSAGLGALATYLVSRRSSSGRVDTSEAAVLWDQAQKMREELVTQRDKAMEQRDRLIESQSAQVLPVLQLVIDSLHQITESLARLEGGQRG